MPYGPYFNQLPLNGSGGRLIDAPSWNQVIANQAQWPDNVDAQGFNLSNVGTLAASAVTVSGKITTPFISGVSEVSAAHLSETGLTAWYSALEKVITGTPINVVCIGDSVTVGTGSTPDLSHSWVNRLTNTLQSTYGNRGSGFVPIWNCTLNGVWTVSGNDGPFSAVKYASGNTNTVTYNSGVGDSLDVMFLQMPDSGAFTVTVDGGSAVTMGGSSASATYFKVNIPSLAPNATHTVTLTAPASAKVYFLGFNFKRGTTGVQVHNVGYAGKQLADTASYNSQLAWLTLLSPDLTICHLGTNESTTNVALFQANLTRLVAAASAYGSVLINVPIPGTTSGQDTKVLGLRTTIQTVAANQGCGMLDVFSRWSSSGATSASLGLLSGDGINPTNAGHSDIARAVTKRIVDDWFVGKSIFPLPVATALTATSVIPCTNRTVPVTTASNTTLTSAPSIAAGKDGQELTVINVGSFNLTLSDQGTLSGSTLRLTATTLTLGPRQNITFVYVASLGWVQRSTVVAVL